MLLRLCTISLMLTIIAYTVGGAAATRSAKLSQQNRLFSLHPDHSAKSQTDCEPETHIAEVSLSLNQANKKCHLEEKRESIRRKKY